MNSSRGRTVVLEGCRSPHGSGGSASASSVAGVGGGQAGRWRSTTNRGQPSPCPWRVGRPGRLPRPRRSSSSTWTSIAACSSPGSRSRASWRCATALGGPHLVQLDDLDLLELDVRDLPPVDLDQGFGGALQNRGDSGRDRQAVLAGCADQDRRDADGAGDAVIGRVQHALHCRTPDRPGEPGPRQLTERAEPDDDPAARAVPHALVDIQRLADLAWVVAELVVVAQCPSEAVVEERLGALERQPPVVSHDHGVLGLLEAGMLHGHAKLPATGAVRGLGAEVERRRLVEHRRDRACGSPHQTDRPGASPDPGFGVDVTSEERRGDLGLGAGASTTRERFGLQAGSRTGREQRVDRIEYRGIRNQPAVPRRDEEGVDALELT